MATKTIGSTGDYTTIQAWIDSLPATLTAPEVGQLQNQAFPISSGITFAGHTTDSTNTITLECVSGASFRDHANKATNPLSPSSSYGAIITSASTYFVALTVPIENVVLRGLQVDCSGIRSTAINARDTTANVTIENCLVRSVPNSSIGAVAELSASDSKIRNTLVINDGSTGSIGIALWNSAKAYDCTVVRTTNQSVDGKGIATKYGASFAAIGNAIFGFTTPVHPDPGTFTSDSDYNATDQSAVGTLQGTHNLLSQTYGDCFEDTGATPANADFRLKAASPLIDTGVVISGITVDVIGQTRTTPDIGAWEFAGDATPVLTAGAASFVSSGPDGITVTATDASDGTAPYAYQWQRNEDGGAYSDLTDGGGVSGATTLELVDGSAVEDVLYGYRLVYTDDDSATATSNAVTAQVYTGGSIGGGGNTYSRGRLVNG